MKNYLLILFLSIAQMMRGQLIHDESYLDAEFSAFKAELTSCVLAKDKIKLETLLADSIVGGYDDCESNPCSKKEILSGYFQGEAFSLCFLYFSTKSLPQETEGIICYARFLGLSRDFDLCFFRVKD